MEEPQVIAITLNWNGREMTLDCVESLLECQYPKLEIIVVDNGSSDGTPEAVRARFPDVTVIENGKNLGYSKGFNRGIDHAMGRGAEYLLILNNDTRIDPLAVDELVEVAKSDDKIGFVTGKVYSFDEPQRLQTVGNHNHPWNLVGGHVGMNEMDEGQYDEIMDYDFIDDVFWLVRREVVEKVGMYDPEFFLYFENTDWCARARRAGFRLVYTPMAKLWHKGSMSSGGGTNPVNTFWMARNRYPFMWRNGSASQRFRFIFEQFFRSIPLTVIARVITGKMTLILPFLKGQLDGLKSILKNN